MGLLNEHLPFFAAHHNLDVNNKSLKQISRQKTYM